MVKIFKERDIRARSNKHFSGDTFLTQYSVARFSFVAFFALLTTPTTIVGVFGSRSSSHNLDVVE